LATATSRPKGTSVSRVSPHHDPATFHGPFGYLRELFQRFSSDQCGSWAAALSFFAILSIVPILICGIAALGLIIRDPHEAVFQVQKILTGILPGPHASEVARQIIVDIEIEKQAAALTHVSSIAGVIGVVSFLWSASRIFVNAVPPMNAAFRARETRGFLKMQLYALCLLVGVGALFLLSLLPSSGPELLRRIPFLSRIPRPAPWWLGVFFFLLGVIINGVMYTVTYRFLPSPAAKVTWKLAAVGGAAVAVLWEIAKQGFAFYLRRFGGSSGFDRIYGSLGGLVILILWIYYSAIVLLLGAEIARLYADAQERRQRGANLTPQQS
jgi:membrane protein